MSSQDKNGTALSNEDKPISTVSHKRRVHFPSDESQLRMISVAPEPLSNQPLLSVGVTLQRYRATCQRLQIRPLTSLLEQLHNMEDERKSFQDRLDCLKIINERLDVKHIDAIEEILSRCRFHTLDLDSSLSDDSTLVQLFDVIEYYESCTHLNLSNNRSIGAQGYQALTRYLRKTRYLERLDMNSQRFDDASMMGLGRSLRLSSSLYELHVESCQLNSKMLQKFIQNIRSCPCLRELYLCDNRLQVQDSLLVNELIRSCGQFLHLLDLRSNSLQDNGMSHIASQLSQYDEHHTNQNSISKISFQSNQLTQQGVGFLAKALLHNRTIRSLNLSQNQITNEGLFFLRDALLTNRTINELILRNCRLTDQAAIALAELVAESSSIQYIDIRENNIQASGICGMAIAMKSNKSLLRVDFDSMIPSLLNSNEQPNNTDRTSNQSGSLLSFAGLRRMTVGLGSLTAGTSNSINGGTGQSTRDLLEQKAKWMNDIECLCQRNMLLYEDQLRRQEEEEQRKQQEQQQTTHVADQHATNGIDHQPLEATTLEDVVPLENEMPLMSINNDPSMFSIQDIDDETSTDQIVGLADIVVNDSAEKVEQSFDTLVKNDDVVDQSMDTLTDEVKQVLTDTIESLCNGNDREELQTNILNEKSTLSVSPPLSEGSLDDGDDEDDEKRKIRHSDSLYLLRKKVQNEDDNTSDDESQISTSIEPAQHIVDGV